MQMHVPGVFERLVACERTVGIAVPFIRGPFIRNQEP